MLKDLVCAKQVGTDHSPGSLIGPERVAHFTLKRDLLLLGDNESSGAGGENTHSAESSDQPPESARTSTSTSMYSTPDPRTSTFDWILVRFR